MARSLPPVLVLIALAVCAGPVLPAGAQPAAQTSTPAAAAPTGAKKDDDADDNDKDDDGMVWDGRGINFASIPYTLGDAARGKAIYDAQNCAACHRIGTNGSHTAPDLSDIGAIRVPGQILTSLLEPAKSEMAINRPVTIVTKDGHRFEGRRLNEDTFSVQMIDRQENIHSILKSDMRRYDVGKMSDMPSLKGKLSDAALSDLLAYLVSQKTH